MPSFGNVSASNELSTVLFALASVGFGEIKEDGMITCFIQYELDPFKLESFERYAEGWNEAIPRCGAQLLGYFAPHEGSATRAYGVYSIESLAAYEEYRVRLKQDPLARSNFEFSQKEQFIRRENRLFLRQIGRCGAATK